MGKICGSSVKAWWFNPREGSSSEIWVFENNGMREFVPPNYGEMMDWILVLDDAAKNFPAPDSKKQEVEMRFRLACPSRSASKACSSRIGAGGEEN